MSDVRFARPASVVVKVGSSSLRGADGRLDRDQVANLAGQVADARSAGTRIVLVSSGAVAAGMGLLGLERRPVDLPTLQACAAVGQSELIQAYQRVLVPAGLPAAQVLVSPDDFVHRGRYLNARTALQRLLDLEVVPIVNENDAVATDELAYGDNDHLAALVASMLDVELLVLLSDVAGLHDGDPRRDPGAPVIGRVDDVDALDRSAIGGTGSFVGSGGMRTKVESARIAVKSATHAVVADARRPAVLAEVLAGAQVGTWFVAERRRSDARRLWIGFALTVRGRVHVDAGAAEALRRRGTSLLSVGVVRADGTFAAGDAVEIVDPDGRTVARGLSAYDAATVARLAGRTTADALAALGPGHTREVVHRDEMFVHG